VAAFAVTALGQDRPGIVAAVAAVLRDRGGNVEDSAMTILGGHFAIVLLVEADDTADGLEHALRAATAHLDLTVHVNATTVTTAMTEPTHLLSVYGPDRAGILAGVSAALADVGVNITDLETRLLPGDEPVYAMVIELVAPDGVTDRVADAVATVCEELGVDHTLRAIEAETY
jgi:glycine cleavage system transcriptional repressor